MLFFILLKINLIAFTIAITQTVMFDYEPDALFNLQNTQMGKIAINIINEEKQNMTDYMITVKAYYYNQLVWNSFSAINLDFNYF